jgi:hypothetical protein
VHLGGVEATEGLYMIHSYPDVAGAQQVRDGTMVVIVVLVMMMKTSLQGRRWPHIDRSTPPPPPEG